MKEYVCVSVCMSMGMRVCAGESVCVREFAGESMHMWKHSCECVRACESVCS